VSRRLLVALVTVALVVLTGGTAAGAVTPGHFVTRSGSDLKLDGQAFRFAGTNNYYLPYASTAMVDEVFAKAQAARFTVLRTWGFLDTAAGGVQFQSFDGTAPVYHDGDDGLAHLDYAVWKAGQAGIKLVVGLTNNWSDFGGMDEYVRWRGFTHHDDFYTDPTIRGWYQAYIAHLLTHVNPRTGLAYKDDPTIMTWELGNEPPCQGSGALPTSSTCTSKTLIEWADTMSRFVKITDHHHLVSVGDEGFTCTDPTGGDWTTNCGSGVDTVAFAKLPAIDVMSFHLYPDGWGKDAAWGTRWITDHVKAARSVHKAVMLGEFGYKDKATRNPVYKTWTDAFIDAGGTGLLYWMLAGDTYPDYDGFTVYCPSPVCLTMTNASTRIRTGWRYFPPVADDDLVTTPFNTSVTVSPAADDIAYLGAVRPTTLDLDPTTAGRQTSLTVQGGQFVASPSGDVTFTPHSTFSGTATAHYTVRDGFSTQSNAAAISVTVKPDPTAAIPIASFEAGVDGWAPGNWQPDAGGVSQETDFATDGTHGLHVDSTGGAWFGASFPAPLDLTGKTSIVYDLRTGTAGTSTSVALQVGSSYTWCQSGWGWADAGGSTTVTIDLTSGFGCDLATLSDVRGMFLWFGTGSFDLDAIRAQ
jgi:mannan endo-1,4-beta-mannosidase